MLREQERAEASQGKSSAASGGGAGGGKDGRMRGATLTRQKHAISATKNRWLELERQAEKSRQRDLR
jgi:hypothetical protein